MSEQCEPWVLVVDADDLHGPMVQRQLSCLGFRSIVVEREAEATPLLQHGPPPALVLLDRCYDRSAVGGCDRDPFPAGAIPVIHLTADLVRSRPPHGREPGVLAKPFPLEELELFIDRTLRRLARAAG